MYNANALSPFLCYSAYACIISLQRSCITKHCSLVPVSIKGVTSSIVLHRLQCKSVKNYNLMLRSYSTHNTYSYVFACSVWCSNRKYKLMRSLFSKIIAMHFFWLGQHSNYFPNDWDVGRFSLSESCATFFC